MSDKAFTPPSMPPQQTSPDTEPSSSATASGGVQHDPAQSRGPSVAEGEQEVGDAAGEAGVPGGSWITRHLANRALTQRKTSAVLRAARDLAGAFATVAVQPNPQDHLAQAMRVGEQVGAACAADLARLGGIPTWMTQESIKGQIASLMWPIASQALRMGGESDALVEALSRSFVTLVTALPAQPNEPEFAKLPDGLAVAMSEQRKMAENVIPTILRIAQGRNARFYIQDSVEVSAWALGVIRAKANELAGQLLPTAGEDSDSRRTAYQSMFGTVSVLMEGALARAWQKTFEWVKARVADGYPPTAQTSRTQFMRDVRSNLDAGCQLLRDTFSATSDAPLPDGDHRLEP